MARKMFTKNLSIDLAERAHYCHFNKRHQIYGGDKRLKVKEGRSVTHYCINCARNFLTSDIKKLTEILKSLN